MPARRPLNSLPEPDPTIPGASVALILGYIAAVVVCVLGVVVAYQAMMGGSAGGFAVGVGLVVAGLIVGRVAEAALSRTPRA